MKKYFSLLILSSLILMGIYSCKNQPDQANQALYDEVMKIHDEVMPEMSTMHKLEKQLYERLGNEFISEYEKSSALKAIDSLMNASESMMVWMKEFKLPEELQKQKSYLESEKVRISQVNIDMKGSIEFAKSVLK